MFSFFKTLLSGSLGLLSGWQSYLIISVVALGVGSFLGYSVASKITYAEVLSVQHQYDDYKLSNETDRLKTTQAVVEEINQKNSQIQQLNNQLNKLTKQHQQDSVTIQKVLNNATDSSPLSNSVKSYLKQLRDLQQSSTSP